jgi:hypothetical protein
VTIDVDLEFNRQKPLRGDQEDNRLRAMAITTMAGAATIPVMCGDHHKQKTVPWAMELSTIAT